jgi:hypothetical protein
VNVISRTRSHSHRDHSITVKVHAGHDLTLLPVRSFAAAACLAHYVSFCFRGSSSHVNLATVYLDGPYYYMIDAYSRHPPSCHLPQEWAAQSSLTSIGPNDLGKALVGDCYFARAFLSRTRAGLMEDDIIVHSPQKRGCFFMHSTRSPAEPG